MSTPLLVRHPLPFPTESLVGYVLRLSQENGYSSPWSVYQMAGLQQNQVRSSGFKFERLAKITGRPASVLNKIAFSASSDHPRWSRLLGHDLVPTDLNLIRPKLCPQCIDEKGFIEAHWHLELMVACPVHHLLLASCCPKCGKRLRWFRPALLECECGGDLLKCDLPSIPQAEARLLDVIRRKILSQSKSEENPTSLPLDELMTINLRSLLALIRTVGKHRMIANNCTEWNNPRRIVTAAAQVMSDWPNNFIALLNDLGERLPSNVGGGVGKQFAGIYCALFKSKAIRPREDTNFLRVAFLGFARNHWGRGYVDHKLMREARETVPGRFLTQTEFAAQIGVRQITAARMLKKCTVPSIRIKSGSVEKILVDVNAGVVLRTSSGAIYRSREAAKCLGLSVTVLQALRRIGVYEVRHLSPTRQGFHELDVEAFRKKLLALASSPVLPNNRDFITLEAVVKGRHESLDLKVNLLRAMLAKEIPVVGSFDGKLEGLRLYRCDYQQFVAKSRTGRPTVTLKSAIPVRLKCTSTSSQR